MCLALFTEDSGLGHSTDAVKEMKTGIANTKLIGRSALHWSNFWSLFNYFDANFRNAFTCRFWFRAAPAVFRCWILYRLLLSKSKWTLLIFKMNVKWLSLHF